MSSLRKLTVEDVKSKIEKQLKIDGKDAKDVTNKEMYYIVASLLKNDLEPLKKETEEKYRREKPKQMYYLSMEFLVGTFVGNNLLNHGVLESFNEALRELGFDPEEVYGREHDAGLGNGGLGRLAACFLDSLASLNYAGHGYGIRYRYGLFEQRIIDGNQVELPDYWLRDPYVWETKKEDEAVYIHFNGDVRMYNDEEGRLSFAYDNTDRVKAVPHDVPVVGFENDVVNTLRLWSAEVVEETYKKDMQHYLDFQHSVEQISGFLYPDDSSYEGKELRLKQQYFLVSSSIQNILYHFKKDYGLPLSQLPEKVVIQINDTHPSLAIPEMMRILMDEEKYDWDEAWRITTNVFAYTNHTTLSEALEKWPISMMKPLLPRVYMIIEEINERFCQELWKNHPEIRDEIADLAIISYDVVHMARLAIVGSFSVNGVAKIHTEILKHQEMNDFYKLYPDRFNNKTNGITHRRWLLYSNPDLADLITDIIGPQWVTHPNKLISLLKYSRDSDYLERFHQVKQKNKQILADIIYERNGIKVDPNSIFDVQIKRLHEYKRQLLNVFHIIYLYNELKDNPDLDMVPRTFIFGAKAAPSYHMAKEVIKLINKVADVINNDPEIDNKIKVVFLENYNVSLAERIIPAADVSEQISTASKEASGTGNMKLMMNGALTVGTLDGANVEIKEAVGDRNIFIFGLTAEEVLDYYENGGYSAFDIYNSDDRIKRILDQLNGGMFGTEEIEFKDIYYNILHENDPYFILKDFESYVEIHEIVEQMYRDREKWLYKSVANIAHSGKFSSDRTIQEYASEIWNIKQLED